MTKTLHPLLNEASSHYEKDKRVAIQEAEKLLTVGEMIGVCKFNNFQYGFRRDTKGTPEADKKKAETYKNYLNELEDMNYLSLGHFLAVDAIKITKRAWAYRHEELVNENRLF